MLCHRNYIGVWPSTHGWAWNLVLVEQISDDIKCCHGPIFLKFLLVLCSIFRSLINLKSVLTCTWTNKTWAKPQFENQFSSWVTCLLLGWSSVLKTCVVYSQLNAASAWSLGSTAIRTITDVIALISLSNQHQQRRRHQRPTRNCNSAASCPV